MGEHRVRPGGDEAARPALTRARLDDLRPLDRMISAGMFETTPVRIGAEQEADLAPGEPGRRRTVPPRAGTLPSIELADLELASLVGIVSERDCLALALTVVQEAGQPN